MKREKDVVSRRICLLFFLALLFIAFAFLVPGCDTLVTEKEVIIEAGHPIADFVGSPRSCCAPCPVRFADSSRGPRQIWIWNYGDGVVDTFIGQFPDTGIEHIYNSAGVFDVSLTILDTTVVDTGFDTETKYYYITDSICPGGEVSFLPPTTGAIFKWIWDFRDGSTSTFNDTTPDTVTHTFDSLGEYWVKLTTTDSCGSAIDSVLVTVVECPVVQFAAVYPAPLDTLPVIEGCAPLTVEFRDESVPPAGQVMQSWEWDFGNGQTSQSQDVTITYNDTGTFVITLSASSGGPSVTAVDTIRVYDSTSAAFIAESPTSSCYWPTRQFQVKFKSESLGKIDSLFWAFGDGYYDSTNNPTPIHAYTGIGIYSCTLIVYGTCGIDTMTDTAVQDSFIIYTDDFTSVGFSKAPDSGTVDTAFIFIDTSTGIVLSRQWIIDPQGDSLVVNDSIQFSRTFVDTGWHYITLTISNNCDTAQVTDSVRVIP
jgi:PKD repeat protein